MNTTAMQRLRRFYHAAFQPHGATVCLMAGLPPTSEEQDEAERAATLRAVRAMEPDHANALTSYCAAFAEGYVHLIHMGEELDRSEHDIEVAEILAITASFYRGLVAVKALDPLILEEEAE